jgi:hypothetical protein
MYPQAGARTCGYLDVGLGPLNIVSILRGFEQVAALVRRISRRPTHPQAALIFPKFQEPRFLGSGRGAWPPLGGQASAENHEH